MTKRYYDEADYSLEKILPFVKLTDGIDIDKIERNKSITTQELFYPSDMSFTHETAVCVYHGKLFVFWFNSHEREIIGHTMIRGRISEDLGKTWTEIKSYIEDETEEIRYTSPTFWVENDTLYCIVNEMIGADLMHAVSIFKYNENEDSFTKEKCILTSFKIASNIYKMNNGKLIIGGMNAVAYHEGAPFYSAVIVSDDGKAVSDWRNIVIPNGDTLPDGAHIAYPELNFIIEDRKITAFSRNQERHIPILFKSNDYGETWTGPYVHDIPFHHSNTAAGILSNGRKFVIGNLQPDRSKLVIFLTNPGEDLFTSAYIIQDKISEQFGYGFHWSYPNVWEYNGMLYISYTSTIEEPKRGAMLSVMPIDIAD